MTPEVYKFDISRTGQAVDLHSIITDIHEDETLNSADKVELLQFIASKFCQMNTRAAGPQKPRWQL